MKCPQILYNMGESHRVKELFKMYKTIHFRPTMKCVGHANLASTYFHYSPPAFHSKPLFPKEISEKNFNFSDSDSSVSTLASYQFTISGYDTFILSASNPNDIASSSLGVTFLPAVFWLNYHSEILSAFSWMSYSYL